MSNIKIRVNSRLDVSVSIRNLKTPVLIIGLEI